MTTSTSMLLVVAFIILATSVSASAPTSPSSNKHESFYYGRSGDAYITTSVQRDITSVFVDSDSFLSTISNVQAPLVSISDVSARAVGVEPLSAPTSLTSILNTNLFYRPSLAVTLLIDGVTLEDVPSLSSVKGVKAVLPVSTQGHLDTLTSTVTYVSSLFSSSYPSQNGIVGSKWQQNHATISAFQSIGSSHLVATLADVLSQSSAGNSLTLSFSADAQIASALGVHPSIQFENSDWLNVQIALQSGSFVGLNHSHQSVKSLSQSLEITLASIESLVSKLNSLSATYNSKAQTVTVQVEDTPVVFSFDEMNVSKFFAELGYIHSLPSQLSKVYGTQLSDRYADSIAICVSGVTGLIERFGDASAEVKAARSIINVLVPSLIERFSNLSPKKSITSVILMNSDAQAFKSISSIVESVSGSQYLSPNIYFPVPSNKQCDDVTKAIQNFNSLLAVTCAPVQPTTQSHAFKVLNTGNTGPLNTTSPYNASIVNLWNGTYMFPKDDDLERWQIALWFSVCVSFAVLAAVYNLAFMDFKKDTLLYSGFNPNWEDRKRR